MRRSILTVLLLALTWQAESRPHVLAVFGDMPYGTSAADTAEFDATPAFLASIEADRTVELAIHLGDLHSGKQPCTEAYDRALLALFQRLTIPFVYTPGDNEWMDCHKPGEGGGTWNAEQQRIDYVLAGDGTLRDYAGGDPLENLALIRRLYFPRPGHTLGRDKAVTSQARAHAAGHSEDGAFVENVRYVDDGVLYAFVNIPGGSNNGEDPWYGAPQPSRRQRAEIAARTGATVRWIEAAYAQARRLGAKAMVIGTQADLWDTDGRGVDHVAQYEPYVQAIGEGARRFGRPVLLLVGDSHVYRSDNPFEAGSPCVAEPAPGQQAVPCTTDAATAHPGYRVANLHRVVVHGSSMPMEWLRLRIDATQSLPTSAESFGPFAWSRVHP
jgi:Calcineurin-like phosphoesterase